MPAALSRSRVEGAASAALWLALTTWAAGQAAVVSSQGWRVSGGEVVVVCPLTVGGSFEARTGTVVGGLATDPARPGRLTGEIAVDLSTLDSGIGLRNTHMRDNYLEIGRGEEYRRAVLSDIVIGGDPDTVSGATTFTGTLLVHGVRRPVRGEARIVRAGGDVRVEAAFPVALPEHGIARPRYLGVGVRDQVRVKVRFTASAAGRESGR